MTRKDYEATAEILKFMSDKVHPAVFSKVVNDFALIYAKDNTKFDITKFHSASNYKVKVISNGK
jgi:hypothetical protein